MPRRKISQREAREALRKVSQLENATGSHFVCSFDSGALGDLVRGRCQAINAMGGHLVVRFESNTLYVTAVKP